MKNIRTPLAHAKGLGSAHSGAHHWLLERLTSVALIPLVSWFAYTILQLTKGSAKLTTGFFQEPLAAAAMALFIIFGFWHTAMGLQVVIEDYVHCKFKKIFALLFVKLTIYSLGVASLLAIIKLHLA